MALDIRGGAGTGLMRINPSKAGLIMGACCRYRRVSIKFFLRSKPPSLFSLSLSCAFPAFRLFSFSISTKRSREERFNPSRWEGSEATEEMDETKMLESFFPRVGREEEGEGSCCVETSGSLLSDPQSGIVDRFFFPSKNYDLESLSCCEYFSR